MIECWLKSICQESTKYSIPDFIATGIAAAALGLSIFQFFRDGSRQKKEATLNAYNELQKEAFTKINDFLKNFSTNNGKMYLNDSGELKEFDSKHEKWEEMTEWLAKIEIFSVGIITRIYSINVLNRIGGAYFIRLKNDLSAIITKKAIDDYSQGRHYNGFIDVANKLEKQKFKNKRKNTVPKET